MGLREKYAHAIQTAKGKFEGSAQEKEGKLHFVGSVKTEADANLHNYRIRCPTRKQSIPVPKYRSHLSTHGPRGSSA